MKILRRHSLLLLGVAATLSFSPGASAGTVLFTLTGVSGGDMGGVYTSPYIAKIGSNPGVTMYAICDNWTSESYVGQSFDATVTNVASLQGEATASQSIKFDKGDAAKQQKDYVTAAYLATEILAVDQSTQAGKITAGEYSFALWGLFAPEAFNNLAGQYAQYQAPAMQMLADARIASAGLTPAYYGNVDIYTPSPDQSVSQEFIVVRADEPSAFVILGLESLSAMFLILFLRRRLVRANLSAETPQTIEA